MQHCFASLMHWHSVSWIRRLCSTWAAPGGALRCHPLVSFTVQRNYNSGWKKTHPKTKFQNLIRCSKKIPFPALILKDLGSCIILNPCSSRTAVNWCSPALPPEEAVWRNLKFLSRSLQGVEQPAVGRGRVSPVVSPLSELFLGSTVRRFPAAAAGPYPAEHGHGPCRGRMDGPG